MMRHNTIYHNVPQHDVPANIIKSNADLVSAVITRASNGNIKKNKKAVCRYLSGSSVR